jgi:hypothetical protein
MPELEPRREESREQFGISQEQIDRLYVVMDPESKVPSSERNPVWGEALKALVVHELQVPPETVSLDGPGEVAFANSHYRVGTEEIDASFGNISWRLWEIYRAEGARSLKKHYVLHPTSEVIKRRDEDRERRLNEQERKDEERYQAFKKGAAQFLVDAKEHIGTVTPVKDLSPSARDFLKEFVYADEAKDDDRVAIHHFESGDYRITYYEGKTIANVMEFPAPSKS